ncbi:hypothetical protein [Pseudonocardia asaccharolytica]|uniref:Uncharacterized protein n=1 Tax=Pseudonocardia asaccharolytica DSM 44247 = NBRC 16224 TaxID=1123024 RepID=A0A511CYR2_9PSEU|nr:hypothetical protein [Pseudonocardia asaccharolytica]GEL17681.1 hypothetical protein PA7_15180 [Pseudonocardia asaccharolytica DSM 44247 = NBRC 16224]
MGRYDRIWVDIPEGTRLSEAESAWLGEVVEGLADALEGLEGPPPRPCRHWRCRVYRTVLRWALRGLPGGS